MSGFAREAQRRLGRNQQAADVHGVGRILPLPLLLPAKPRGWPWGWVWEGLAKRRLAGLWCSRSREMCRKMNSVSDFCLDFCIVLVTR